PAQAQAQAQAAQPAQQGSEGVNLFEAAANAAARQQQVARPAGNAPGLGNLDFLRNNPQFQQLRQAVQQNPQMLEPILQQVAQGNPQLATIISQNPEAFLSLLGEGFDDEEGGAGLTPGGQHIQVTEEERNAIERVSSSIICCGLHYANSAVVMCPRL